MAKKTKAKRRRDAPMVPSGKKKAETLASRARAKANTARRQARIDKIIARTRASRAELDRAIKGVSTRDLDHLPVMITLPRRKPPVIKEVDVEIPRAPIRPPVAIELPPPPPPKWKFERAAPMPRAVARDPDRKRRVYRCSACGELGHPKNSPSCSIEERAAA